MRAIRAASWCAAVVLAGCSAPGPAGSSGPAAVHSARAAAGFTVAGTNPVLPSGSQDTRAQTPAARCDSPRLATDRALGGRVALGFAVAGFPASADLLQHFLDGQGTAVAYRPGSQISKEVRASAPFLAMDHEVQDAIFGQLKAGRTRVRLSAAQLPALSFGSRTSDLYWGFRGTQGLSVTGTGRRGHRRYAGSLTYVIRDSYGFPASDTLDGFGPPMRYLQTVCGAPQHPGGARWFPVAITVTVPFRRPADRPGGGK